MDHLPSELFLEIFSLLDLAAIRNARLVSKKWKILVIDAHPEIHFVVPVTDDTLDTIIKLTEMQVSLHIQDFTGKGSEVVSATEGTGLLFGQAERIKFTGDHIAPAEIQKRLPYAIATVRELSFVNLGDDITMRPLLAMTATFSALRKLEIVTSGGHFWGRTSSSGFQTVFDCYTSIIQRLAAVDSGPQIPLLESLKLSYNPSGLALLGRDAEQMFANFLAIAKLILKFRRTLKEVEIECNTIDHGRNPNFVLSQAEQTEWQQCIDTFNELINLNRIRLASVNVRDNPWDWELELLRRPRNLKDLVLPKFRIAGGYPDLARLLPENRQNLTTIKIGFSARENTEPVDVGVFGLCPELKTLWLDFFQGQELLHLTNVDKLPRQVTSLHLKSNRQRDRSPQHVILAREQIRWIVDNLQNLESFWTQLVVQTTDNPNARQPIFPFYGLVVSSPSNIDVELFRDIMNMSKINDLKFDMMKASNLAEMIPIEEIREYSGMYKYVPSINTICRTFPVVDYERPVAYAELTIQID